MTERRSQPRLLDADLVLVSWEDDDANRMIQLGNVEDVSLSGLAIIVDDAIPPGTRVGVSYGDEMLAALGYPLFKALRWWLSHRARVPK